jgi:hypothetical protein
MFEFWLYKLGVTSVRLGATLNPADGVGWEWMDGSLGS